MEISFKARYINKAPIKVVADNAYKDANFIKLDIHNEGDKRAINRVANSYCLKTNFCSRNYAVYIRDKFNTLFYDPLRHDCENFYALTVENVNENGEIENPDADKILGVAQVNDNPKSSHCSLMYLQVDPATNYSAFSRKYTGVGKAIWDSILKIFQKDIIFTYDDNAEDFYKEQGCKYYAEDKMIYKFDQTV